MVFLRKLRGIRAFLEGIALRMVFFVKTSHCAYAEVKALLSDRKNCCALFSLLKAFVGGFV